MKCWIYVVYQTHNSYLWGISEPFEPISVLSVIAEQPVAVHSVYAGRMSVALYLLVSGIEVA